MIKFENVNVTMQGKRILSDINLEIQDGEFVLKVDVEKPQ